MTRSRECRDDDRREEKGRGLVNKCADLRGWVPLKVVGGSVAMEWNEWCWWLGRCFLDMILDFEKDVVQCFGGF